MARRPSTSLPAEGARVMRSDPSLPQRCMPELFLFLFPTGYAGMWDMERGGRCVKQKTKETQIRSKLPAGKRPCVQRWPSHRRITKKRRTARHSRAGLKQGGAKSLPKPSTPSPAAARGPSASPKPRPVEPSCPVLPSQHPDPASSPSTLRRGGRRAQYLYRRAPHMRPSMRWSLPTTFSGTSPTKLTYPKPRLRRDAGSSKTLA